MGICSQAEINKKLPQFLSHKRKKGVNVTKLLSWKERRGVYKGSYSSSTTTIGMDTSDSTDGAIESSGFATPNPHTSIESSGFATPYSQTPFEPTASLATPHCSVFVSSPQFSMVQSPVNFYGSCHYTAPYYQQKPPPSFNNHFPLLCVSSWEIFETSEATT